MVFAGRGGFVTRPRPKGIGLQLDSLCEKPLGAGPQHIRQGIVDLVGLTKPDDFGICVHRVSLSLRGSGRLDTRPDSTVVTQFPA